CGERDLGAVARKEAREMPAEAARSAGDENMLIADFEHGDLPASCHYDRPGGVLLPLLVNNEFARPCAIRPMWWCRSRRIRDRPESARTACRCRPDSRSLWRAPPPARA